MALAPERNHANGVTFPSSSYSAGRQLNPLKRPADDSQDNNEQRLTKRLHLLHLDKAKALRGSLPSPQSPTQIPIHPSPSSPRRIQKTAHETIHSSSTRHSTNAAPPSPPPSAGLSDPRRRSDADGMQVEDTPNRVYIGDLDAEIAELEAAEQAQANDEAKTIRMASALAAKLARHNPLNPRAHGSTAYPNLSQSTLHRLQSLLDRAPPQPPPAAPSSDSDGNQGALVLYSLPSSLSVPAEHDGVRAAVEGARLRARQRQMAWGDSVAHSGAETSETTDRAEKSSRAGPAQPRLTHDWRGMGGAGDLCAVDGAGEDMGEDEDAMDLG